jgi:glucose-1-phosphate thymidylyltransferase
MAIPTFDEEELFIILGDTIFDVDLNELFRQKNSALGVKFVEDPRRFGVALIEDGYIQKLIEKPQEPVSNMALVGLYYITNRELFTRCLETLVEKNIRTKGELQLTDALQLMIDTGQKFTAFPVEGWYDCGKPETLLETNSYLLSLHSSSPKSASVIVIPPVYIPEGTIITNSVIGPNTTSGEGVEIHDCIIRNSIIGKNAKIEISLLQNSLIGNNSEIIGSFKQLNSGDSTEIKFY